MRRGRWALLADKLKGWIDRLGQVWIEGEITQWGPRGQNVYGKLKDLERESTVSFQIWSSRAGEAARRPEAGRPRRRAREAGLLGAGRLAQRCRCSRCSHVGLGDLLERLEQLRRSSPPRGCSSAERKRRLPFLPNTHRPHHRQGHATPRRTCCATPSCAGRTSIPRRARRRAGRPHGARGGRRAEAARGRPRGRRDHRSPAAAATSRTCSASATSGCCAPSRRRRRRSSARSGTRTTGPCSTTSPTSAPPRRPTPRSGVVPDVTEELNRVRQARARIPQPA